MKPLVGISCCSKSFGPNGLPNHAASDFAVRAVAELSNAIPVLLPALGSLADTEGLLDRLDGIVLTGSRTNIAPASYGGTCRGEFEASDPGRDATTLPLIRAAIHRGTPILAICRGLQELNVALGGTLHQMLADIPGRLDHAACQPEDADLRVQAAHCVVLTPHGRLAALSHKARIGVNSLHQQGIDRLAPGLRVEAHALDGTIEAVSHAGRAFVLGVQWHPEFDAHCNAVSANIFAAFGASLFRAQERLAAD